MWLWGDVVLVGRWLLVIYVSDNSALIRLPSISNFTTITVLNMKSVGNLSGSESSELIRLEQRSKRLYI